MPNGDYSSKLWWAVPAAGGLVLVALAMLFGGPPETGKHGTSYDASPTGFRAAYLLLEEVGYPVFRARRPGGGSVRWVLYPTPAGKETPGLGKEPAGAGKEATALDGWVREGGVLLLADNSEEFARGMGIPLTVQTGDDPGEEEASGLGVARLAGGATRVEWPGEAGEVLVEAGGRPAVTVYSRGAGEVWLVNRPELVTNEGLRRVDNAVLLCRLATEMLHRRPGQLAFDEYCHDLRDRPDMTELLFRPPTVWVTLHGLALLGLLLWRYAPRFGHVRPLPAVARRSKEEFLDAMASLLERKGDHAAAFRAVRDAFAHELERDLGLPGGVPPEQLAEEAARRGTIEPRRLLRLLTGAVHPPGAGPAAFLKALDELESARDEFFRGRPHR